MVEPGVTNLAVSRAVGPTHFYPPDPSSQIVCSIGGNVAENSGGAHCFKYGFTTNYVTGLEVVLSDGEVVQLERDAPGYDLLGAFVGSEGTLGVATKITLRVIPVPQSVRTLVAFFEDTGAAGEAVSEIVERRNRPGRNRDDGPPVDQGRRGGHRRRVSARRRRGAAGRARRPRRGVHVAPRARDGAVLAHRRDGRPRGSVRSGAGADLEGPQGRVRSHGADRARLLRPGRRDSQDPPGGGAAPDRRARCRVQASGRQRLPRRRRQPAPADLLRRRPGRARRSAPRSCRA